MLDPCKKFVEHKMFVRIPFKELTLSPQAKLNPYAATTKARNRDIFKTTSLPLIIIMIFHLSLVGN